MRIAFLKSALVALLATGAMTAGVVAAPTTDALTAARFEMSIDGRSLAVFSELLGISSVAPDIPAPTGVILSTVSAPAGKPIVVLRRPMTRNIEMAAWHELVILGDVVAARKSLSLTMYNTKGDPVARYHLTDAWPQKIEVTTMTVGASTVLMETVTMTGAFIQRVAI